MTIATNRAAICNSLVKINVGDKIIVRECSDRIELLWFNVVPRIDKHLYDLVITNRHDGTCEVEIKKWEDSGILVGGGPAWFNKLMFTISIIAAIVFIGLEYV